MFVRVYQLQSGGDGPRNRAKTIALITVALAVGAFLLAFALMLLLALAAAGTVIGAGVLIYRRLMGRRQPELGRGIRADDPTLDPSMEVFPDRPLRSALPANEPERDA